MLSLTGLLRRSSSCSPCPEEESELVFAQYWAALLESLPDGRRAARARLLLDVEIPTQMLIRSIA